MRRAHERWAANGAGPAVTRRRVLQQLGGAVVAATASGCLPPPNRQCAGPAGRSTVLSDVEAMVVVMMENRSFDHHLGALHLDPAYPAPRVIDGLSGVESNPDETGEPICVWRLEQERRFEPHHQWSDAHRCFDLGRNDGFVQVNIGEARIQVMGYHDRASLPVQYALADQYTVCDRWFSSVLAPTWPNRFYLHAATSAGLRVNQPIGFGGPATIWERMGDLCQETRNYFAGPLPWYAGAFPAKAFSGNDALTAAPIEDFFQDARAGNLPPFSLIDPDFWSNDGHPKHDLALSEIFIGAIYRSMAESPQWRRSLLVIVYDENGGFYDHVPPPQTADAYPDFRQLGFRVPALVIGPTVWSGGVVSTPFDHASIAATLATRFGIASLGTHMDAAQDLSSCIDPARVGAPVASPRALPLVEVTAAQVRASLGATTSQRELADLGDAHQVPAWMVDARTREERLTSWLRHAQELDVARVRR
jgi:phospholipase C